MNEREEELDGLSMEDVDGIYSRRCGQRAMREGSRDTCHKDRHSLTAEKSATAEVAC